MKWCTVSCWRTDWVRRRMCRCINRVPIWNRWVVPHRCCWFTSHESRHVRMELTWPSRNAVYTTEPAPSIFVDVAHPPEGVGSGRQEKKEKLSERKLLADKNRMQKTDEASTGPIGRKRGHGPVRQTLIHSANYVLCRRHLRGRTRSERVIGDENVSVGIKETTGMAATRRHYCPRSTRLRRKASPYSVGRKELAILPSTPTVYVLPLGGTNFSLNVYLQGIGNGNQTVDLFSQFFFLPADGFPSDETFTLPSNFCHSAKWLQFSVKKTTKLRNTPESMGNSISRCCSWQINQKSCIIKERCLRLVTMATNLFGRYKPYNVTL